MYAQFWDISCLHKSKGFDDLCCSTASKVMSMKRHQYWYLQLVLASNLMTTGVVNFVSSMMCLCCMQAPSGQSVWEAPSRTNGLDQFPLLSKSFTRESMPRHSRWEAWQLWHSQSTMITRLPRRRIKDVRKRGWLPWSAVLVSVNLDMISQNNGPVKVVLVG